MQLPAGVQCASARQQPPGFAQPVVCPAASAAAHQEPGSPTAVSGLSSLGMRGGRGCKKTRLILTPQCDEMD